MLTNLSVIRLEGLRVDLPRINGLDLFSGIGGISIALSPWVRTVAYCEQDRYAQSVLLSRQSEGKLHRAPIWDDVQTLTGPMLPPIDIIFGGFPCQDISVAGNGVGLEGKRSGLFYEIIRLTKETGAPFVFLENVPAIRTRGLREVIGAFTEIGYDCRWTCLSAASVGAPHKRERWFLLAYFNGAKLREQSGRQRGALRESSTFPGINGEKEFVADAKSKRCGEARAVRHSESSKRLASGSEKMADPMCKGLEGLPGAEIQRPKGREQVSATSIFSEQWWSTEPNVGRVANGVHLRAHRIKCLGNSVVPLQVREAFRALAGIGD